MEEQNFYREVEELNVLEDFHQADIVEAEEELEAEELIVGEEPLEE